ncbi:MAG: NAD(P)/FAD-dependent oxidoreductase [Acidobacteriia bacterium]|nr:NAD(P)/FAD-dependent oxidoreductase [Terriglobia bacterium]
MNRRIPRRDFLNGVAIGITGAYAAARSRVVAAAEPAQAPAAAAADYPPLRTGLRGNDPVAIAGFGPLGRGDYRQFPALDVDTREVYDLVIVGGGISGLAAAHFWRRALGQNQKILVLDNHDDFGGHAKRNEFKYQGRTFIGYGGTMGIATPFPYSYTAKRLVEELGIQVERNNEFAARAPIQKLDLGPGMFFDKEHFGEDRLVAGNGRIPWPEFFAKAPLSDQARKDLIRVYGKNPDYLAGLSVEAKIAKLATMSWQDFLVQHAKVSSEAIPFFMGQGGRNNKRVDTTPALEAARRGSVGFNGLGLEVGEGFRESSYTFHFPDGNASLARLLVNRLLPSAVPGAQSMETILQAPVDYAKLDESTAAMRIRLSSTVVRVQHAGPPDRAKSVRIAYLRDGKVHGVSAANVVLACYNSLIPALMPELPAKQQEALAYSVKVPMMYNNVLIRRWTAFAKLGVSNINSPCMLHTGTSLDPGTTISGYRGVTTPDEPILVHMTSNPNKPGLPRKEQNRAGQQQLLSMTFEQFELEIRRHLTRMLGSGGFDPATDIVGLTVNRWPYGYSYTYDTLGDPDVPPEQRPHVIGRQRFGLVTIANSDAGAAAFTNQAIDEAHRAVEELFVRAGLT